jgi:hypothetical protein
MAFFPAAGVAQTVVTGHIAGHKFNNVMHWNRGSGGPLYSSAELNTLCDNVKTGIKNGLQALFYTNITFNQVTAVDLGTPTPAVGASSVADWTGTGAGELAPSLSTMVNLHIPARYRGGKPRVYFPPMAAFTSGFTTFKTLAESSIAGLHMTCVLYTYTVVNDPIHNKYIRTRSGVRLIADVSSFTVSPVIRSQRRRMTAGA